MEKGKKTRKEERTSFLFTRKLNFLSCQQLGVPSINRAIYSLHHTKEPKGRLKETPYNLEFIVRNLMHAFAIFYVFIREKRRLDINEKEDEEKKTVKINQFQ